MAEEMQDLIVKITAEVLKRMNPQEEKAGGTLAVFSGYIFDAKGIKEYLDNKHPCTECVLLDNAQYGNGERIDSQQGKDALAGRLQGYEKIVIVTPPLSLIGAIARGDDTVFSVMLAIRPLLWGREVTVLLDFEAPKNRRSPAFLKIAEDIGALEEMGIRIECLRKECAAGEELRELVTEQDVKDASKGESKSISIKPGAIVTQLAEDTAKELGVKIGTRE